MNQATKCSYPYLTGMGLRNRCHLIYDEFQKDPANKITQDNQVIFVKTDLIYDFFISKFDKNFTYYQIIFNGTPNIFLQNMSDKNYNFDTQNKVWILK